jgi:polyhydroxybutyrate depolymerase
MRLRHFQVCFTLLLLAFVLSCGGGNSSSSTASPEGTTLVKNLTLPGFPHQIEIYSTTSADKAVVFLHGGGELNYEFAYKLGLNLINKQPTNNSINWDWLIANKIIAVFPQGQAISSNPSAYTWSNHVMDSGVDDMAFLQALATYIKAQYGISNIYLAGHSNGGMMANRAWCEAPDTFNAYISLSGPASDYYLATPCSPATIKPYCGITGGHDHLLQVLLYGWTNRIWKISDPFILDSGSAMLDPTLIGEWYQQVTTRGPMMCNEVPVLANGVTVGGVETWDNCNGKLRLQEVLNGEHTMDSLQTASGQNMRDLIMSFITQLK